MALLYLRHILFDMLPSPEMKEQGQLLSISNHLEMLHDSLWAINAVIIDGELQDYYMQLLKEKLALERLESEESEVEEEWEPHESELEERSESEEWKLKGKPVFVEKPELEEWVKEVDLVIVDVEGLLSRILHRKPRIAEASNCSSHSFPGNAHRALFRRSVLKELEEMVHKLNYLRRRGHALGLHREMLDSMHPLQEEYSDILRDEVVGRDMDKDHLINLLKEQQPINNGDHTTSIIVIKQVKHYRFGEEKTALARMIYHDIWVREYFEYRIWVDAFFLSDPNSEGIAKEILRSIRRSEESLQEENANWSAVKDLLSESKYLLILDNYMNFSDRIDEWVELKDILLHLGRPGSAVIINMYFDTRSDHLKNISKHVLCGIPEDGWKELLVKQAVIHPTDANDPRHARVPLTLNDEDDIFHLNPMAHARIVGAIVRFTETNRWNDTDALSPDFSLKYQLLDLLPLLQSYESTVHIIRYVFSSLFPVNPIPSESETWQMWGAEGLLPHSYAIRPLFTQWMSVFNRRINRKPWAFCLRMGEDARIPQGCIYLCFLLDSYASGVLSRRRRSRLTARINKKLRMLVLLDEGRKEDDIFLEDQIYEFAKGIFKKLKCLRILYIWSIGVKQVPNTLGRLRSLRYLSLRDMVIVTLPESLCSLYNLRILNLRRCEKLRKLPEHIGKLVSLHSLVLTYCTRLEKLPKSISRLASLENLDVHGCHWLIELPEGMENTKLRELYMEECASLTKMPLSIKQMTRLEVLTGLVAAYNDDDGLGKKCIIQELQGLTDLTVLYLRNLERVSQQVGDIWMIKLQDKRKLVELGLHWEYWNMDEDIADAASLQVIEALKPNPLHLKFLAIISYPGKDLPSWMKQGGFPTAYSLNYLIQVRLINIKGCESLPPLGYLPFLKNIEINGMDSVCVADESFYGDNGIFPSLETIIFSEMPILEEWQEVDRDVLPRLEQLILIQCPKFKGFHPHTCIRKLSKWLNNTTLWMSNLALWENFNFVESLEIVGCHELKCFPLAMQQLRQLKKLKIISCNQLEALPDWLQIFEHLEKLYISNCAMLSFVPKGLKLTSLRLKIEECPKLKL